MDALSYEVHLCLHALIVQIFELVHELHEDVMALNEIVIRNSMLLKNSDTSHKSAEVQPVLVRQQVPK
jgi:hypothetical protein